MDWAWQAELGGGSAIRVQLVVQGDLHQIKVHLRSCVETSGFCSVLTFTLTNTLEGVVATNIRNSDDTSASSPVGDVVGNRGCWR
jgi:hypothetical protein